MKTKLKRFGAWLMAAALAFAGAGAYGATKTLDVSGIAAGGVLEISEAGTYKFPNLSNNITLKATVEGRGGTNVEDCFKPKPDFSEEVDTLTTFRSWNLAGNTVFPFAHVFSTSWANPHPEKTIASVAFERGENRCAVIGVFGVTLGAKTSEYAKLPKSEREKLHDRLVAEASAAQKENRLEDAIAAYEKAIRAVPERVWVYRSIGGIYEAMKDWNAALTTYRRSLEADYNQPDVWEAEKRMLKKLDRK